jgi:hypothetical protein
MVGVSQCQRIKKLSAVNAALGYTKRSYAASVRNGVTGHEIRKTLRN